MKLLITGKSGQVGKALTELAPKLLNSNKLEIIAVGRSELNLGNEQSCRELIETHKPDWLINTAAFTAVDMAESMPNEVKQINSEAPRFFAESLFDSGGSMIQISTDYVFDGTSNHPYKVDDERRPICLYGKSKSLGEENVEKILKKSDRGIIIRTSSVISPMGNNFLLSILKLHKKYSEISVVDDQISSLTSSYSIARACLRIIELREEDDKLKPIIHWSGKGSSSWYEIALEIGKRAEDLGLINKPAKINPIKAKNYPSPANRPKYSSLDCESSKISLKMEQIHWKESIEEILIQLKKKNNL